MQQVFDGHNDVLTRLYLAKDRRGEGFFEGRHTKHVDLPRARAGGFAGGFFAIWIPSKDIGTVMRPDDDGSVVDDPEPGVVDYAAAREAMFAEADILQEMAQIDPDAFRLCTTAEQIETARKDGAIAALMHLEGAEGIGRDLEELDRLHAMGLRSLGPVWSRPNRFAHGVPFKFPHGPDIGPGLTDDGVRLVKRCGALDMIVDLSHMNEAGFWDIAKHYDGPLVATHSNVHAICPSSRNLTDKQLDAIAERDGVVGLNFAVGFLRADGRRASDMPLETMLRHLDYLIERLGEGRVALGSDFDGALVAREIGDARGLPNLIAAMERAQYGSALIERIAWSNWIDLIRRVVG